MASVTPLKAPKSDADERQLRVDLAAVFRMAAALGWHEATANHFSVAVSADGKRFLMNPRRRHFARIKASDLLLQKYLGEDSDEYTVGCFCDRWGELQGTIALRRRLEAGTTVAGNATVTHSVCWSARIGAGAVVGPFAHLGPGSEVPGSEECRAGE